MYILLYIIASVLRHKQRCIEKDIFILNYLLLRIDVSISIHYSMRFCDFGRSLFNVNKQLRASARRTMLVNPDKYEQIRTKFALKSNDLPKWIYKTFLKSNLNLVRAFFSVNTVRVSNFRFT